MSTRDAVTFGFGLEQVDQATRNDLVKRSLAYLLPATPDTTPPAIVGFKYPANLSEATPRDPVEIELTAYDERGDMDYVDLKAGDQLVQRTEVYPFQFRYTPPASAVGSVVKLTATAVDKAGNSSSRDLLVNVVSGDDQVQSPVPVNPPALVGTPTVGSQMSCISGGFLNAPEHLSYAWLRSGEVIAGAISPAYTLTAAELGRTIACRVTATNQAGTGDATSAALVVSNPVPAAAAPFAAAAPAAAKRAPALKFAARCTLAKSRKAVSCLVSSNQTAKFTGKLRLTGAKAAVSKSGKRKLHLTLRSHKRLKKGQKVVLTLRSGRTTKILTAKLK
jgi:hypothetical protein